MRNVNMEKCKLYDKLYKLHDKCESGDKSYSKLVDLGVSTSWTCMKKRKRKQKTYLPVLYVHLNLCDRSKGKKEERLGVDDEDDQESYFNARKDIPLVLYPDEDDEIEYDSDGNPLPPQKSKVRYINR